MISYWFWGHFVGLPEGSLFFENVKLYDGIAIWQTLWQTILGRNQFKLIQLNLPFRYLFLYFLSHFYFPASVDHHIHRCSLITYRFILFIHVVVLFTFIFWVRVSIIFFIFLLFKQTIFQRSIYIFGEFWNILQDNSCN